jgi:hypothetical protein
MEILGVGSRVNHTIYGKGVVIHIHKRAYEICFMEGGIKTVSKDNALEIIEKIESEYNVSFNEAEEALMKILREWSDVSEVIPLGEKWQKGLMILKPGDSSLKDKEIPIESFFHKIVMLRDRLRVLEQRINSHEKLTDEDKINIQQYITRIYGSLTTFNVLFKHRMDYFEGEKSEKN